MRQKIRGNSPAALALALGLFGACLGLYVRTLAPGMLRGDPGELQYAMVILGVPHATGYPLYTILGWLWLRLIPWGDLAYRANLLSALLGALSISLVGLVALRLTKRPLASLAGALYLALSYVFWTQSVVTEVYVFNLFFLALLLYLLVLWEERTREGGKGSRLLYAIALVYGLGLAHHGLMLLVFPALLLFILWVDREVLSDMGLLLRLAGFMALGLAPYLFIFLKVLSTGGSLSTVIFDVILGKGYLGLFFGLRSDFLHVLFWLPLEQFGYLGLLLAGWGAYAVFRSPTARPLAFFLVLTYGATVLFSLFYRVPDVEVFLTPTFLILALWMALGIAFAGGFLPRHIRLALETVVLLSAFLLWNNYSAVATYTADREGGVEARAREILACPLEQGAILEGEWGIATALKYLQAAEGLRSDLQVASIALEEKEDYEALLAHLDSGKPVYFILYGGLKVTRFPSTYLLESQDERFLKVTRGEGSYVPVGKRLEERVSLLGYETGKDYSILYWAVEGALDTDYSTYLHAFDLDGGPLWQADKGAVGEAIYIYPTSHWRKGDVIQDLFPPIPPETAYLRAGLYRFEGEELVPLGSPTVFMVRGADPGGISHPLAIELGDAILLGYDLAPLGETLQLTLYWSVMQSLDRDYNIFIHLLDGEGEILAQGDGPPLGGLYPTSLWRPGEVVRDVHSLPLPSSLDEIKIGLYDWRTGERLPRRDASEDYVLIGVGE